jgi:hypothetical protein
MYCKFYKVYSVCTKFTFPVIWKYILFSLQLINFFLFYYQIKLHETLIHPF